MANQNTPFGFPGDRAGNGSINGRLNRYEIAGALAANIYRGSPVKTVNTNKRITAAAAGDRLIGIFSGCNYVDAGGNVQFRPYWGSGQTILANTVVEANVFDDPNALFVGQVSGAAGLAVGNVGALADAVIGTGSTVTGQSGDMIDQTTIGSGTQFRIEELWRGYGPGGANAYGQYAKAVVRISKHNLGPTLTAA